MDDHRQMIHDLALIHTKEKYHEFFESVPVGKRGEQEHSELQELVGFYYTAVNFLSEHVDEIIAGYLDENGNFLI